MDYLPPFFKFFYSSISFLIFLKFSSAADTLNSTQPLCDGNTLVSSGQTFELGFFSPANSKNRYLGIWYKKTPGTVVWVANRNDPIGDSVGVLTISNNGTLVLLNGTKSVVWSSNLSAAAGSPVAQLLDSGNLVVRDNISMNSESYLWQSFDYPCDTMLPGMKIGRNLNTGLDRYLMSWKGPDDPTPGDFTYRIDMNGLPQIILAMGSIKKGRSGLWNGVRLSGLHDVLPNSVFKTIFTFNEDELYYMFELYNSAVLTRYTLNQSGFIQRSSLRSSEWAVMYTRPIDLCDNYGHCGANAVCRITKNPICECLKGFTPKSQEDWEMLDFSSGCVRRTPLDCQSGEGFANLAGLKLPDLLDFSLNKSMSLKECEALCLKNCSCTAYTNSNISGGRSGCLMWFGDLIDITESIVNNSEQDIYLRLPAWELEKIHDSNMKKRRVTILVVSTISGILILGLVFWCIWRKRSKIRGQKSRKEDLELPLFDLATIARATNNFSDANMLGAGGFGPVYKGDLSMGLEIAVKRLSRSSGQGLEEFMNEIVLIAKLQHKNLVSLLGCCIQGEEMMLIYEYMPNKSLDYFIFDQNRSTLLPWKKRFDIVMAIVRGLLYLHQDSRLQIIHRDLKTSNILLDSNLNPKISDFGLARIFKGDEIEAKTKRVVGTYGYMSPEYATDGRFSVKSDVFSLGVLFLEIVSGKKNRGFDHPDHHHNLLGHAWLLWNEDKALELMDTCLEDSFVESQVLRCIQVGLLCVQKFPQDRPITSSVVHMLANEGVTLPQPKQPGFFIERSSIDTVAISKEEEFHTENAVTISKLEGR